MKSLQVTIFVLVGCSALVSSAEEFSDAAKTLAVVHRDDCDAVLGLWVGNVKPTFKSDSLTLDVDVTSLYDTLRLKNCFSYDQLWLELWWVTDIVQNPRPDNFGSASYFSKYERCHQLEPEHFVFHSSKQLDSNFLDENEPKNIARVSLLYFAIPFASNLKDLHSLYVASLRLLRIMEILFKLANISFC